LYKSGIFFLDNTGDCPYCFIVGGCCGPLTTPTNCKGDAMTAEKNHDEMVAEQEHKAQVMGFGYQDSRLSPEAVERIREQGKMLKNYERGIISGGEFDCLIQHGCLPYELYDKRHAS
jgi:hypothetical protein